MKNSRNKRFISGFVLAILLVLIVGSVSFYTLHQQAEEAQWVEHTYKVLNKVDNIEQLMVDMETGRRGFRCTNDKEFLEPYYKSQPKVANSLAGLKTLVGDNAAQVRKVTTLETDVMTLDSFWKGINVNTIYNDEESKRVVTQREKTLMDVIRVDITAIRDTEHSLLSGREQISNTGISQAIWSLVIGIILILLVVVYLITQVISSFRSRMKAEDALHDKLNELGRINADVQTNNWLLAGIREINGSLIGSDSLKGLVESCMMKITAYMNIPAGAFYFYSKEQKALKLEGSIAMPQGVSDTIQLNEGITGRAATQRELTVINDIPADYWKISSAGGGARPDTIICLPLWQKNELRGVIELAGFGREAASHIALLNAVANNIAVAVHGAYSNERMSILFQQVQEQKEELESQQEELRQTNEELIHQTEILKASEEELRTQEEELRQVNAEIEEKTEAVELARVELSRKAVELEASSKYKSEFLANMSHELRTPLNSVLILAALLKENKTSNLTEKQIEYSKIIHKSGSDLLELINDILDLSKIEAGKIDIFFEEVKVKDVAYDMEQTFTVLAQQKKINFVIAIDGAAPAIISTDKQRLEQVIKNLLSNAFKFTPENGKVSLDIRAKKNHFLISVSDTGIGISAEKQQLIFEAFQQADGSTSRKFGGTGLGLSISKELIKRLHGEIRLTSAVGEGSTFSLVLPYQHDGEAGQIKEAASETEDDDAPLTYTLANVKEQTAIEDDKSEIKPGEQSILIIEDDPVFAQHVNDFAHSKGYKTIIAISGDEGIHCAKKYKPAAIILDLGLPVIDGRSVLKILKSDESLKHIPVHLVTAEDRVDVPIDNVVSYHQKPLKDNELERAFTNIRSYITEKYKNILILSPQSGSIRTMFEHLTQVKNAGVLYTMTDQPGEAITELKDKKYDCIIADIGSDIQNGLTILEELKANDKNEAYVITCLDSDISTADEKQLKKYSDSIIRKSTHASNRLLDEVELFLHKIKSNKVIAVPARYEKDFDKSLSGKKVLLADDDMRNVFALTALLEEQGMQVVAAENGKEALALLAQNPDSDIILMDIMMPEMDGYETMRHIRAEDRFKKMPIIALTAKAMTGDREKCLEAGASDYITKPLDSSKLFSLMRVWIAQ